MTTEDLMKLADKFAFFMPGSEEGEQARQALLDALQSQAERIKAQDSEIALLRTALPTQYHSRKDWYSWSTQTSMHCPLFENLSETNLEFLDNDYAKALSAYLTDSKKRLEDSASWIGDKRVSMIEQRDALRAKMVPLEKDAERYRFALEDGEFAVCEFNNNRRRWVPIRDNVSIDAAMGITGEPK